MPSLSAPDRLQPMRKLEELREMFRHGVSLEEFRKHYYQYQKGTETHAEFRRVDAAIQFLEDHGGYIYPELEPGAWITEGRAWVAVDGYLPLHKYPADWFQGQIEYKFLVNVIGIYAKVLVMDAITAKIWEYISANPIGYDKALHWTLIVRPLMGDQPKPMDIERMVRSQVDLGIDPSAALSNGRLSVVAEHTSIPSLPSILDGKWVAAPRRLVWFDGNYHLLLLPAWILVLDSFYEVRSWTYFI